MRSSVEIGKIIKQQREKKKLTVTEFANRVGVNKSTISRYENGSRKIPMEDITKFANALDLSPQELLLNDSGELQIKEDASEIHINPKAEIIAAHIDDDATEEEIEEILAYIEMRKSLRKKHK